MLFEQFWDWLTARLEAYVSENVAAMAQALEPVTMSLAVLYVMVWGYLHLRGAIEEPVLAGALRIVRLVVVIAVALRLWLYNAVIVQTFMEAPVELAAFLAGAADPIGTIDALWDRGGTVAASLWEKGGVFDGDLGYYLAAIIVYGLMGFVCVYALFLLALARVALAVLLAIGPLFIVLLLFEATQRYFEAWVAQLANYALINVLAVLVAALMLTVVEDYAAQTAEQGAAILTVDVLDMLLVAGIVLLILRQVMPMAARLAGGVSLASFGVVSGVLGRGSRIARTGVRLASVRSVGAIAERWPAVRAPVASVSPGSVPARVAPVWRTSRAARPAATGG